MATQVLGRLFLGKTKSDVEYKFTNWQMKSAGKIRIIKKHPIVGLPLMEQPMGFKEQVNTFSMLIDHELIAKPQNKSKRIAPGTSMTLMSPNQRSRSR
jgi:hypothetical protein